MGRLAERARADLSRRGFPVASVPGSLLAWLVVVNLAVAGWAVAAVASIGTAGRTWGVLAMLVVLAFAIEESASRAARLQLRLSSELKRDMTSVWAVAGAVALRPGAAVLLLTSVLVYVWFRQQRQAREMLYRKWYSGSSQILGCLVAGVVLRQLTEMWSGLPWGLAGALAVLVAIAIQTAVNRLLVTVALWGVGVRGRALLGSQDDNLIELATLCLGGLVALAILHQPWLAVLVVAPMMALQRGAWVRELEAAATIDSKTGLLNAIAWEHVAKREIARAEREHTPLAVLIIDIDRFKLVNDRWGHLVGDAVLKGIGKCLSTEVREYDTVGRFGGEEFVAVLPAAGEVDALVVAERLRARVHSLRVSDLVEQIEDVTDDELAVSIGVACLSADGDELTDLLHSADGALYRAKALGRNRVLLAGRGPGQPDRLPLH